MVGWGIVVIIMGAGSLLLPLINYQFMLMELVDPYQPFAGIIVAVIGAAMVFMGMNRSAPGTTASVPNQPSGSQEGDAFTGVDAVRPEDGRPQP